MTLTSKIPINIQAKQAIFSSQPGGLSDNNQINIESMIDDRRKVLSYKEEKKGEMGSPCLTPLLLEIQGLACLLIRKEKEAEERQE